MVKQSFWSRLREWANVRVDVEAHRRFNVAEARRQFYRDNSLLVPEGGPAVTEQMWMEAGGTAHSVAESGPLYTLQGLYERDEPRRYRDPTAVTGLGPFRPDPDPEPPYVYVAPLHIDRFTDAHSRLFEDADRYAVTDVKRGKQGEYVVRVGRLWYAARVLWESDGTMAGWIVSGNSVQDHADLPDVARDGAWLEPFPDHAADPPDHVGGGQ